MGILRGAFCETCLLSVEWWFCFGGGDGCDGGVDCLGRDVLRVELIWVDNVIEYRDGLISPL